jgi:hypothetical protein
MQAYAPREMVLLPAELHIAAGTCYAVFAYDVGLSIVLEECERRITALTQRATIRHKHRAPDYFEYRPAPLRVSQEAEPLLIGGYRTHPSVDAVLYDFGAVSITYRIPLQGAFSTLLALGDDLYDNPLLLQDSRQRIAQLLEVIASAVVRPHTSDFVEDYAIFQVEAFTVPWQAEALCAQYAQEIAQLLRLERHMLSEQEVSDALSHRISFSPDDVTIIDWNAAFFADFRRLKFTHNGTHVLAEVPDTRKLQCEVFFPLPLTIAESHCTRLSGSSVRLREAMMR